MPDPSEELLERLKSRMAEGSGGLRLVDPRFGEMVEMEPPSPVGGADRASTRLTFRVPGENTGLNIGTAHPTAMLDEGIVGRTDNHVSFHAAVGQPTFVNLGTSATLGGLNGSKGFQATGSDGYGMVTYGKAWHESKDHQYVITQKGHLVLRSHAGGSFLAQADGGTATLASGKDFVVGSQGAVKIVADAGVTLEDPTYGAGVEGKVKEATDRSVATWTHAILDQAQAVSGIVRGVVGMKDWPNPGEKGFTKHVLKGFPPMMTDAVKLGAWISSVGDWPNTITANAQNAFTAAGDWSTVWGSNGALLGSVLTADVVAATVGMKAAAYAGVWAGVSVSVEGLTEVSLSAPLGEVSVEGRKDVAITSAKANVLIGGGKTVDLSAPKTYVHGENEVRVIAGTGAGMGVTARGDMLFLGEVSRAGSYAKAKAVPAHGITISDRELIQEHGGSMTKMSKRGIDIDTKDYNLDASQITMNGKKVLIG